MAAIEKTCCLLSGFAFNICNFQFRFRFHSVHENWPRDKGRGRDRDGRSTLQSSPPPVPKSLAYLANLHCIKPNFIDSINNRFRTYSQYILPAYVPCIKSGFYCLFSVNFYECIEWKASVANPQLVSSILGCPDPLQRSRSCSACHLSVFCGERARKH